MLYMTRWSIKEENTPAVIKRFTSSPPALPPGVKMLGRWHEMGSGDGFALVEASDPIAVTRYILAWADLVDQKVYAVITDEGIGQALSAP